MSRYRNPSDLEKAPSTSSWIMARRRGGKEDFPILNYFDQNSGELTPAVVKENFINRGLPEDIISFDLLSKGQHPFVILAERRTFDPQVEESFMDLMANLDIADTWEALFLQTQTKSADLYVIDRNSNRYLVKDVIVDSYSSSGVLALQPLGKRGRRQPRITIDIKEAYGFMLPIIVYKPYR